MTTLNKQTLSSQVYELIKDDIINQRILPGSKLTLKMLQNQYDLSTTPLREAMNRLSQEGLLEHVTNVGAKVISMTVKDVEELYDFCQILDTSAMSRAMLQDNQATFLLDLQNNIIQQKKALDLSDLATFRLHSDLFHDLFFHYADNSRLYEASLRIRNQLSILINQFQDYQVAHDIIYQEHVLIYHALQSNQLSDACDLLNQHFEQSKHFMLNQLSALVKG